MKYIRILFFAVISIFSSCAKKQHKALAHNYYKLAFLELTEEQRTDVSLKRALEQINKAVELVPDPRYLALKATLLFQLGYHDESKLSFEKALKLASCDGRLTAEIMNNYACVLSECNESEKALSIWRQLEMNKDYLTPEVCIVNQAKARAKQGNYSVAKALLQRAITIAPQYVDAHYYLVLLALKIDDRLLAQEALTTLTYLEPTHPGISHLTQACHQAG